MNRFNDQVRRPESLQLLAMSLLGESRARVRRVSLVGAAIMFLALSTYAFGAPDTFLWSFPSKDWTRDIGSVTFFTGHEASRAEGKRPGSRDNCDGRKIVVKSPRSERAYEMGPCDDHVNIVAAFPNKDAARVAVVQSQCGGSICVGSSFFVFYIHEGELVSSSIDYALPRVSKKRLFGITFELEGNELKRSETRNLGTR